MRNLVDGYRELNELVEQAPARVMDAASEYAQALGVYPSGSPLATTVGRGVNQVSRLFVHLPLCKQMFAEWFHRGGSVQQQYCSSSG